MIVTDPSSGTQHGCQFDDDSDDGVPCYTGEGQIGAQELKVGNLAILGHRNELER